jgi:hypothetical protein
MVTTGGGAPSLPFSGENGLLMAFLALLVIVAVLWLITHVFEV